MQQKDQPIMNRSASKQGQRPYRRGERKRTPFTTEQKGPPVQEEARFQQTLSYTPIRGVVLLVTPEMALRWHLGNALLNRGYSVVEAATAVQAIEQLEQKIFDLVLLDVDLPDDTGGRLLRALAASPLLAPPLILLPERQRAIEPESILLSGKTLPEPSWLADLLQVIERIRSSPGPPANSSPEGEAGACISR